MFDAFLLVWVKTVTDWSLNKSD